MGSGGNLWEQGEENTFNFPIHPALVDLSDQTPTFLQNQG